MEILKVSSKSNPNSVAGALANVFREKGAVVNGVMNFLMGFSYIVKKISGINPGSVLFKPVLKQANIQIAINDLEIQIRVVTSEYLPEQTIIFNNFVKCSISYGGIIIQVSSPLISNFFSL